MSAHPEWFLRGPGGEPLKAGYNTNWTTHQDGFAYALDPTHPAFTAHLSRLFGKLTAEFGYSYLKLDFLYAAAAQGARHDQRLTRAQALRRGLEAIRSGAGERTFILGCGCPLGPAIGIVERDANRRGCLSGLDDRHQGRRSTRSSRAALCIGGSGSTIRTA